MPGSRRTTGRPGFERRATVLLAEDDRDLRELFASALRDEGYEVVEVASGHELLDVLGFCLPAESLPSRAFVSPDVVISDIRMPGLSGLQVAATLQQADWTVPVILMTAVADDATRTASRRLGAVMILEKPVDTDELCAAVRSVL